MAGTNITFSSNVNQITINGQAGGGGIAASDLTSTTRGLGSIGYLSSVIINLSSIISTPQLTSSLQGLGSLGYLSTTQLASTVANLGQIYNSTILVAGTNITFSSNVNQITINGQAGGGGIAASDLTSTTKGLGSLAYLSSFATISSVNLSSGSIYASFLSSQRITASSITANKFVGDGSLITNVPNLGVTYITAGTGIGVNTNTGNVTVSNSGVLSISQGSGISITGSAGSYTITATGGVAGTVATADLVSTVIGIQLLLVSSTYLSSGSVFASLLSSQKITASSITANKFLGDGSLLTGINAGLAASDLTSTIRGLGTAGYLSSSAELISTPQLTSSLIGLGTFGYTSSLTLRSTIQGLGTFGYLSSSAELISSPQLTSSLIGLGTFGYLSSSAELISSPQLTSSLIGLGTFGYLSSSAELISSPQLTSSLIGLGIGLGTFGYTSSLTLRSTIQGLGTFGYLSSSAELISSPQLTSSLMGLGSMTYLSSFNTLSSLNISSGSLYTSTTSTTEITAGRMNFGTLFVNNAPIIFDQYGNLQLSFQTL